MTAKSNNHQQRDTSQPDVSQPDNSLIPSINTNNFQKIKNICSEIQSKDSEKPDILISYVEEIILKPSKIKTDKLNIRVGDKVYLVKRIWGNLRLIECVVKRVRYKSKLRVDITSTYKIDGEYYIGKFGKEDINRVLFLNKKDAERAYILKKDSNNNKVTLSDDTKQQ